VCVRERESVGERPPPLPLGSLGGIIEVVDLSGLLINSSAPIRGQVLRRPKIPPHPVHACVYVMSMCKELRCACSHP
jgi:hypothetical protein